MNKDSISQKQIFPKLLLSNGSVPIVTTDEVATAIQVDGDGDATGYTSLTDTLS